MSDLRDLIHALDRKVAEIEWNHRQELDSEQKNELYEKALKDAERIYANVSTLKARFQAERKTKFLLQMGRTRLHLIMIGSSVLPLFNAHDLFGKAFEVAAVDSDYVKLNLNQALHWITPECKTVQVWQV
jgi:hypothetical protein